MSSTIVTNDLAKLAGDYATAYERWLSMDGRCRELESQLRQSISEREQRSAELMVAGSNLMGHMERALGLTQKPGRDE